MQVVTAIVGRSSGACFGCLTWIEGCLSEIRRWKGKMIMQLVIDYVNTFIVAFLSICRNMQLSLT